jgi:GNAT superfamily N-acetyltransferase
MTDAPGIRIRLLSSEDADAYAVLRAEALERHPLAYGSGPVTNLQEVSEALRSHIAHPDRAVAYGAYDGADFVGVGRLYRHVGVKEAHKCDVLGMYVTATHRQRGIGRALLQALVNHARTWPGVTHVHIGVTDAAPEAARLYETEGFRRWGSEPAALRWDGRSVAEHRMVLALAT